jgi:hypothetical protein
MEVLYLKGYRKKEEWMFCGRMGIGRWRWRQPAMGPLVN